MITTTITLNLDKTPWTDLDQPIKMADIIRVGRLPNGTTGGKCVVEILMKGRSTGDIIIGEITLDHLRCAVEAFDADIDREKREPKVSFALSAKATFTRLAGVSHAWVWQSLKPTH
jgi:hypothetical protein